MRISNATMVVAIGLAFLIHSTRGVVKTIDATSMTVARAKKRGDITFALNPSVKRDGAIAVGSTVAVRYHDEGWVHVASAITAQPPAPPRGR